MMIFLRAAIWSPPPPPFGLPVLSREWRRAIAFEEDLHLALRLFQLRRRDAGEPDALLERPDRLLQREPATFQPLHHLGQALEQFLVLLRHRFDGGIGHGPPLAPARGRSQSRAGQTYAAADRCSANAHDSHPSFPSSRDSTCVDSSPTCSRTRNRSPASTRAASVTARPRLSNATA